MEVQSYPLRRKRWAPILNLPSQVRFARRVPPDLAAGCLEDGSRLGNHQRVWRKADHRDHLVEYTCSDLIQSLRRGLPTLRDDDKPFSAGLRIGDPKGGDTPFPNARNVSN